MKLASDKFEDEENKSSKNQKSTPKTGGKGKPVATDQETVAVEESGGFEQTISLFAAIGLMVASLVIGLVVGYLVAPKGSVDLAVPTAGSAPSLTQEQLNSNQLPPSHPAIPGLNSDGTSQGTSSEATAPDSGDGSSGN